jgi:hypothetical protein
MTVRIRLIRHEAMPKCGSYEVRFPDGKPSRYFYWEDAPGRRLRDQMTSEQALEQAREFASAEQDKLDSQSGRKVPRS